jgi:cell division protein FtsB
MAYSVRWDRLGRVALLAVLSGVVLLYVSPAHSYWQTWRESRARNTELSRLEAEHDRLLARRRALREPASLMREARRLGMVRRGERAFVLQDLPKR